MPVADWESDIMNVLSSNTSGASKACFSMDLKLYKHIRSISVALIYENTSNTASIMNRNLLQLSVDEWTSDTDQERVKEIKDSFELTLGGIRQYQVRLETFVDFSQLNNERFTYLFR